MADSCNSMSIYNTITVSVSSLIDIRLFLIDWLASAISLRSAGKILRAIADSASFLWAKLDCGE